MSQKIIDKANKALEKIDAALPVAYESDKSAELGPLLLELKGLVIQIKAEVRNASGKKSSLPVNFAKK